MANNMTDASTVSSAFRAEAGKNFPSGKMETQGNDVSPLNLHKKGAAPKADKQPVNSGTFQSKHTPDMLFDKDRV